MKLHALREIEQVVGSADVEQRMTSDRGEIGGELSAGWDWVGRLNNLGSTNSSLVINVRLSLASMARVSCKLQGDFWLEQGKRDRKSGMLNAAVRSLKMADREYKRGARAGEAERSVWRERENSVLLQLAKVKHAQGLTSNALQMVEKDGVLEKLMGMNIGSSAYKACMVEEGGEELVGKMLICSNRWLVESNLRQGREILNRYEFAVKISSDTGNEEKSHFQFARYCDVLLEKR